jgi:prepilin-type N-terminal cleavage/methylation domain-containing protein
MHLRRGFTLIELLVVIAIIGLLSSVVLASLNGARKKAEYTAVATELRETTTAFYTLSIDNGCWPGEGGGCAPNGGGNPTVQTLVDTPSFGLGKYLPAAPSWPVSGKVWRYDNDGDSRPATCTGFHNGGANLYMIGAEEDEYELLDKIIDGDSDPTTAAAMGCGRVTYHAATKELLYSMTQTQ